MTLFEQCASLICRISNLGASLPQPEAQPSPPFRCFLDCEDLQVGHFECSVISNSNPSWEKAACAGPGKLKDVLQAWSKPDISAAVRGLMYRKHCMVSKGAERLDISGLKRFQGDVTLVVELRTGCRFACWTMSDAASSPAIPCRSKSRPGNSL